MDEAEEWARQMLLDGASVGQVIRRMERPIEAMRVLMQLAPIGLREARDLVMGIEDGNLRLDHMGLPELDYLADVIARDSSHSLIAGHVGDAIRRGHTHRWFVRGDGHWQTRFGPSETDLIAATSATLEQLRDALHHDVWRDDIRIVRDEPDVIVVELPRLQRDHVR